MKMKRILSLVLAAAMLLATFAVSASAEETTTSAKPEDVLTTGADYSTVYYGGIPWRVLYKNYSTDTTDANAKTGILLLSEHAMANGIQYNAHYSNNAWSSANKSWASAMVLPWDDERNPMYEDNIAAGKKTDDSSGGYITSDIRMYLTGKDGSFEAFRPFAYYCESWPASWDTFADRNGQGWRYYTRNVVTDAAPVAGKTYFVKGEFELSDHGRDCATVNGVTVPGLYPITPADWAEDTWYTLDANGKPVLMTEWPEGATTVNAYYDQAGYYIADVSNGFEAGVTYYTFERYLENVCPKVVVNGQEVAMGDHLAALFKWVGYAVPELTVSDHNDALTETTFVASTSATAKNFASDMGFSEIEKAAVLPTSGHGYNRGSGKNYGWSGSIGSTFGDRLDGDTYFLLSGEEVYLYLTAAGHTAPATHLDGTAAGDLWTRSWGRADIQTVITYANNAVNWYKGANTWWQSIRPAFNLNPEAVLAYIPVADNAYRMVMKDADKSDFAVTKVTMNGTVATVVYNGAVVGKDEYISCVAKNESGKVYYTKGVKAPAASGTVEIDLAETGATGELSLCFINETYSSGLETSYAKNVSDTFGATIFYTEPDEDETTDNTIQGVVNTVAIIAEAGEYVIVVKGDRTEDVEVDDYTDNQKIAIVGDAKEIPVINGNFLVNGENKSGTAFILKNIIFNNSEAMPAVAMFARNVVYTVDVSNVASSLIENVVIANKENGISFAGVNSAVVTDTTIDVSGNAIYVGSDAKVSITSGTYNGAVEVANGGTLSITGGFFSDNVSAYVASGYELTRTADGYLVVKDGTGNPGVAQADSISIEYKDITAADAEGEKTYEIVVKANDGDSINELASADLTFVYTTAPAVGGAIDFTVAPAKNFSMSRVDKTNRYMFNYDGVGAFEGSGNAITIGTIKVEGYGKFTIATKKFDATETDTNIVNATTLKDNLVDSYTAAGADDTDATTGALVINKDTVADDGMVGEIKSGEIAVPTRELTINVAFPNAIEDNVIAYQDMMVEITGNIDGVNKTVVYNLGEDVNAMTNGAYVVTEDRLVLNNAYTVTVSGAGYRTARYTVTMTNDKELNFWNNVMDEDKLVEKDKATSNAKVTFLAGDIVKDNDINIYDLSAVVSYFATSNETDKESDYAKYDLNRDGVIDSKDVAYVLVSWNN